MRPTHCLGVLVLLASCDDRPLAGPPSEPLLCTAMGCRSVATFVLESWPTDTAMTATVCADGWCREFWIKTPITAGDPICTPVDPDDVDDSCKLDDHHALEIGLVLGAGFTHPPNPSTLTLTLRDFSETVLFSATQVAARSNPFYPNGEACDARADNWCQGLFASFDITKK